MNRMQTSKQPKLRASLFDDDAAAWILSKELWVKLILLFEQVRLKR